jgi:hypothetical protein
LHESSLPGHLQALLTHCSPALQVCPHEPQLFGSLEPSMQLWPQVSNGAVQIVEQAPDAQTSLAEQAFPQRPQLSGSVSGSMHAVPHSSVPLPHVH